MKVLKLMESKITLKLSSSSNFVILAFNRNETRPSDYEISLKNSF